jgi:hypothetical protein
MELKKKKKVYKMFIDEEDMDSGVFAISLVESPAIEANWITLSKQLKIELATADTEKRILLGPVLIPNKLIPRLDEETGEEYDIKFDEAVIEKAAQLYMMRQHNNDATLEHAESIDDLSVVESWLVVDSNNDKSNAYGLSYPVGTWMVMMKVNNPTIWEDYVKNGVVKGFSLEGLFGHNLVEASKQQYLVALSELIDIFDNEYAEELLATMKGIIKKDGRLKDGQRVEMETYNDYPDTVKNAAKRGIALNEKVNNKCATDVGKIRAQQLANGRNVSVQTIKRMYAYTSRAREFYNPDDTSACGTISYLLWGGDAANRWSAAKLKELGLFNGETAVSVGSSYAGQFGPGKKYKAPAQLSLAEGVPHYTADGELYEGPMHRDAEGRLMTGEVHTEDSEYLYHAEELAEIGPRGGVKSSPKAPKSDTPNPNPKGEGTAKGDASGKRGAEVSAKDEETLKNKAAEFNDKESNTKNGKAGLGALKSVFQRGLGAYNTSRSPNVSSPSQWAFARVNAFLYLIKNGRPQNPKYDQDNDLLPKGHPKAS